jgi:hypothetical protein
VARRIADERTYFDRLRAGGRRLIARERSAFLAILSQAQLDLRRLLARCVEALFAANL